MAKHGRKGRKFRRYLRGNIDHFLALGTLNNNDVIGSALDTVVDTTWVSSIKATWSLNDLTPITDAGPILVGIAHSDYSDPEIEAFLENTGSWDAGDMVSQELARRKIRVVGTFQFSGGSSALSSDVLNDGRQLTTKCGWMLSPGDTLRVFAYNTGSAALATTDPSVRVQGHANLWPQ